MKQLRVSVAFIAVLSPMLMHAGACPPPVKPAAAVTLVNMVPKSRGGETYQESEPTLAVNANDPLKMAAAVMTSSQDDGSYAPVWVTTNGGLDWTPIYIVPAVPNATHAFVDPSLAFGLSGVLYAAMLRTVSRIQNQDTRKLNILKRATAGDFADSSVQFKELTQPTRAYIDQPYAQATAIDGKDVVFVGSEDRVLGPNGKTATIDQHVSPLTFSRRVVEARDNGGRNGAPVRVAIHAQTKRLYSVFFSRRKTASCATAWETDLTLVRDDGSGTAPRTFQSLQDVCLVNQVCPGSSNCASGQVCPGDGKTGKIVVKGILQPKGLERGGDRFGPDLAIAVDPNNVNRVYIAWADITDPCGAAVYNLHVRRSEDGGRVWTNDLGPIRNNAKSPSLAVNANGVVALMYQQLMGSGTMQRWRTRVEIGKNQFSTITPVVLTRPLANSATQSYSPLQGDYTQMVSMGDSFYGIFSASNVPDCVNFPSDVIYRRPAVFSTLQLKNTAGAVVAPSMDPFFVKITPQP